MSLKHLQDQWEEMGRSDPLTAILYRPERNDTEWDLREFFATGEAEIRDALAYIEESGLGIPRRKALDFGCGVGRLTQALAGHFREAVGIDIAPSMIALAERYNRRGERCRYILNAEDRLAMFPDGTFDLVYSSITLQHMPPRYAREYIREFLRVLAPGGAMLFQIPSSPVVFLENGALNVPGLLLRIVPKGILDATYRKIRYGGRPRPEMYWFPKRAMIGFLRGIGARLIAVQQIREPVYIDCRYLAVKD